MERYKNVILLLVLLLLSTLTYYHLIAAEKIELMFNVMEYNEETNNGRMHCRLTGSKLSSNSRSGRCMLIYSAAVSLRSSTCSVVIITGQSSTLHQTVATALINIYKETGTLFMVRPIHNGHHFVNTIVITPIHCILLLQGVTNITCPGCLTDSAHRLIKSNMSFLLSDRTGSYVNAPKEFFEKTSF